MHAVTRALVAVLVVTSVLASGIVLAQADDPSPAVENATGWVTLTVPDEVVRYGTGAQPSFLVTYDTDTQDAYESLESWANSSTERTIRERIDTDTVLVSAPAGDVIKARFVPSVLSTGDLLSQRPYVTGIDFNLRTDVVEPVELQNASDVSGPTNWMQLSARVAGGQFTTSGVAYAEDAPAQRIGEAGAHIGANNVSQNGEGVRVAVLDTGVNTAGGTLYGSRIAASKNFITDETGTSAVADGNGHGSWVASAVAANYTGTTYDGMAPNATLLVGKVLADDGSGSTADIVQGLEWACTPQSDGGEGADVVSMSLGSPMYSDALADAVTECEENGVVVVIAVGNSRQNPATRYISSPADTDSQNVIAVAATNSKSADEAASAYFSEVGPDRGWDSAGATTGEGPDVAAPGMALTAKVADSSGSLTDSELSGTSMATPLVAGGWALALDANIASENPVEDTRQHARRMPNAGETEVGGGMFAADWLISGDEPDESQADARVADAVARDEANRGYSGSILARLSKVATDAAGR